MPKFLKNYLSTLNEAQKEEISVWVSRPHTNLVFEILDALTKRYQEICLLTER